MKKVFVFFVLGILFLNFAVAADPLDGFEDKINQVQDVKEKVEEGVEKSKDQAVWEEKWDYLGKEWPKLMLRNDVVLKLDGFFSKFSLVFSILFGAPYSMSLVLFFIVFLWLFFFSSIMKIIIAMEFFEGIYTWIVGFLIMIVLAQTGFFEKIILFLGDIIFAPKYGWMRFAVFLIIIGVFFLIRYGNKIFAKYLKKKYTGITADRLGKYQKRQLEREEARERARKQASSLADKVVKKT